MGDRDFIKLTQSPALRPEQEMPFNDHEILNSRELYTSDLSLKKPVCKKKKKKERKKPVCRSGSNS